MDTITTITIDYTCRYEKADAFSKTKPTLEQALEFCNRPDIGFTCQQFSGADADGLFTAMFGSEVWRQVARFGCSLGWDPGTEQFLIRTSVTEHGLEDVSVAKVKKFEEFLCLLTDDEVFHLVKYSDGAAGLDTPEAHTAAMLYNAVCAEAEARGYWLGTSEGDLGCEGLV